MLAAGIEGTGEGQQKQQVYQKQVAATTATLLGLQFTAQHTIGKPLAVSSAKKNR